MTPKEIQLRKQVTTLKQSKQDLVNIWEKQIKDMEVQRNRENEKTELTLALLRSRHEECIRANQKIIQKLTGKNKELETRLESMTLRKNELRQQNEALTRQNKNLRRRLELLQSNDVQAVLSVIEKFRAIMGT